MPLTVLRPDVPEDLAALVMRALSSKPRARPASAREMQDELRAVFEAPRRGSASMRVAPTSLVSGASAGSPAAEAAHQIPPPSSEPSVELTPFVGRLPVIAAPEMFDDETRMDQKPLDFTVGAGVVDEASAEHPVRTVRPPSPGDFEIDVVVDQDPATSRGGDLSAALARSKRRTDEDDETETLQLTPEVRRRIEQMTKQAQQPPQPLANSAEDETRPPPTRRLK
jgi:hypothetical protein